MKGKRAQVINDFRVYPVCNKQTRDEVLSTGIVIKICNTKAVNLVRGKMVLE